MQTSIEIARTGGIPRVMYIACRDTYRMRQPPENRNELPRQPPKWESRVKHACSQGRQAFSAPLYRHRQSFPKHQTFARTQRVLVPNTFLQRHRPRPPRPPTNAHLCFSSATAGSDPSLCLLCRPLEFRTRTAFNKLHISDRERQATKAATQSSRKKPHHETPASTTT